MEKIYYYIFLLLLLISYSREDDTITVAIKAISGIINKEIITISNEKKLYFNIECLVDKNITNKIYIIDITMKIKILGGTTQFDSTCNIVQALIESGKTNAYTKLKCTMDYSSYNNDNIVDQNLIVDNSETPTYDTTKASFTFEDFDEIGTAIRIQGLYIYNLEKDFCENKIFKFEMNFTSTGYNPPLESTICDINLSNNEVHNVAKCAIPYSSNVVLCYIDVSEKKITKGEKIEINLQTNSKCKNGQFVTITDNAQNVLEMEVDCDKMQFLLYNIINILFLILIIF